MASVFDAANFFIEIADLQEDCLTNLKLNKLLFFAQAWSLVKCGKPLFDDEIEAWPLGPVVDQVYHKYKDHGREPISEIDNQEYSQNLSVDEQDILIDVMSSLGRFTASTLVNLSHTRGGPWDTALSNGTISKQAIRSYYEAQPDLFSSFSASSFQSTRLIPKRSATGTALLPREELDDWE